ncbi:hypothetical protein LTR53_009722 [Teratosphaeriaceae sp. CCFEE 6253]|nr:hypothetical protein LTR53_009722 [Teratosphaeriaceae sp. CCFEE 6253]
MAPPFNITFGVELELIAAWPKPAMGDMDEYDELEPFSTPSQAIYYGLTGAGVPVTGHEPGYALLDRRAQAFTHWAVKEDVMLLSAAESAALPEQYLVESVELASRKFDLLRDDWRGEIAKVLGVLRNLEDSGCRFFTNKSTGFHVHVASSAQGVPLRTAKNVMLLATAFERCFDELHAANRIAYPKRFRPSCTSIGDFYHTPLSWWHLNNGKCESGDAMLYDWLASIEAQQTFADLNAICSVPYQTAMEKGIFIRPTYGHSSSYNLDNLYAFAPGGRVTGTLEFRQHAGTLDFLEIVNWVLLTTSMGIDRDFGLRDIFSAIECPADTVNHFAPEEEGESAIGFLGTGTAGVAVEDLDALLAHNDAEQSVRLSAQTREAVIAEKDYGFEPEVNVVHVPVGAIERYYHDAWTKLRGAYPAVDLRDSACGTSAVCWGVWQRLARDYKGEVGSQAEAAKEWWAAHCGLPRVQIEAVPDSMPGFDLTRDW